MPIPLSSAPGRAAGRLGARTMGGASSASASLACASHARRSMAGVVTAAPTFSPINVSSLVITRTQTPKAKTPKERLTFGGCMTDHMVSCDWHHERGWAAPQIKPYAPIPLDPACSALHYGIQAFEGMKAFRGEDGKVRIFRPDMNMKRMDNSMQRLALPPLDKEAAAALIREFVRVDSDWIPEGRGFSLYLRPTIISTWPYLGVSAARSCQWFTIASPVGPYYPEGFKPVSLLAETKFVRAWPGGVGNAKVGGNYALGLKAQVEAAAQGFSQVLWLYGPKHEVTEAGTMNFFVVFRQPSGRLELVTPPLDGTILPGVTRDSILALARDAGDMDVSERVVTMSEIVSAAADGRLSEAFGAGTAAVVSPIRRIRFEGADIHVPVNREDPAAGAGPVALQFWNQLTDIQYGKVKDHPWAPVVPGC